jgi:hypothetical protein
MRKFNGFLFCVFLDEYIAVSFMDKWRETSYRITKYNPDNRDEKGVYVVVEWTSFSDIGKDFNGTEFTYQDYITTEDKYIASIQEFCNYFKIEEFEIKNLEFYDSDTWDKYSLELKETHKGLRDKKRVSKEELDNLARLILREYAWCDLESKEKGIHFGYDYYMYFDNGAEMPDELKSKIEKIGLYTK